MASSTEAVVPIRVYLRIWLLATVGGGLAGAIVYLALSILGSAQSSETAWGPDIFIFGAAVAGVFGLAIGVGAGLLGSVVGFAANRRVRRHPIEAIVVAVGGALGALPGVTWMVSLVAFNFPIAVTAVATLAAAGTLGVWALSRHLEFRGP